MNKNYDVKYMRMALNLAKKAKDETYPNPMVGAVIVKNGRVIGKGYHKRAGLAHAEVEAINSVRGKCSGATMYVTLEPCNHYGKTGPCTDAIINSGIKVVKIAMKDPNPINNGRGIRRLKKANIRVVTGILQKEAASLNKKYIKFITKGLPYVTVKLAESLDGKISARDGSSKWISSAISRKYVKSLRTNFDAIMVGSNTVLQDDPFLLARGKPKHLIRRIIVDTSLKVPINSNIIKTRKKSPIIIGTTELAPARKVKAFARLEDVELIVLKSVKKKVPLRTFLTKLAQKGIVNILVEGGSKLVGSLIDEGLVDEMIFFIAPKIIGGPFSSIMGHGVKNIDKAIELRNLEVKRFGRDIMVRGLVKNVHRDNY